MKIINEVIAWVLIIIVSVFTTCAVIFTTAAFATLGVVAILMAFDVI